MNRSSFLFAGGAGYVGSHAIRHFLEHDLNCIVLDDLSKGHREAVPDDIPFFEGKISDAKLLKKIFGSFQVSGILHFAGFIEVGESVDHPEKYFQNNLADPVVLLESAREHKIPWIVFSSSAAVYGNPKRVPIHEDDEKNPNNPYGFTKLGFEEMLKAYDQAYGIRSISLRYFNAAGAHPSGDFGEAHDPESHLIPRICKAALGIEKSVAVFGNDYPTPDGTCIRDYVHIMDLAKAHFLAVKALEQKHKTCAYNVGSENGYSVKEVIETIKRISGLNVPVENRPRRAGDSTRLVASSDKIRRDLGWDPKHPSIDEIVKSAWRWHAGHPFGYRDGAKPAKR